MTDPTGHDSLARALAWVHPAWMLASLGLAALTLRAGLRLRSARRLRALPAVRGRLLRLHLRLARPAVALVLIGFLGGPLSMWALRGREPFGTVHAAAGCLAALLFAVTGFLGHRLATGRSRRRDAHAGLALTAVAAGAVAAVMGFVLLP